MAQVIQLAFGAFLSSLSVKSRTKSWEPYERDQQFGQNVNIDIGKSQRLRKEGNARINKVLALRPGLATIIEKVRISYWFESPETVLHIAENACCIDYADTRSSKRLHSLWKSKSPHCGTSDDGCEYTLELYTSVAWVHLPIAGIHTQVASKSGIQWLLATLHNTRWMHHCELYHGSIEVILILDPVYVDEAYSHIALHYHAVQWHVWSYGWHDVSFG